MSSIIINANNITNTTINSTFQVDFDRTIYLNDKHISLTSASLYSPGEISQPPIINFLIYGLMTLNIMLCFL